MQIYLKTTETYLRTMEIRKDFESVEIFIHRLAGIGQKFARFSFDDWSHLKNREDFQKIYRLPATQSLQFETLYGDGRDCSLFMSSRLSEFNDIGKFPSLVEYVESFQTTWVYAHENLQAFIEKTKELADSLDNPPWAIRRMIELFDDQLRLLASVRHTLKLLRQTNLYKIEKGEAPVEREPSINIGQITGKVNINSTDNSINTTIVSSPVFLSLVEAVSKSSIETDQKVQILERINIMKQTEGSSIFLQSYKDFMQNAANHMSIISPFIPALTALIG